MTPARKTLTPFLILRSLHICKPIRFVRLDSVTKLYLEGKDYPENFHNKRGELSLRLVRVFPIMQHFKTFSLNFAFNHFNQR